ncbi:GTP cyclohydrolase I FolE [Patescibacteria group bacterium]|nr:GTP cyclohydrolase I FolE [Patescibacteria group bacterium]HOC78593.1 GTP cyclohydrolase I FolE [Methanofastidiosum sp.]
MKTEKIAENIKEILQLIGDNNEREGLGGTPERVAKMFKEVFRGYDENEKPKVTVFENGHDGISVDEMIIDTGYFFSYCEHHMVPFFGNYFFSYIPDSKIVGISKIGRIVDYYSAKLQVQERLTKEIVDEIERIIEPKGVALIIKARHLCKEMRGVKKYNSEMITSEMRGVFRDDDKARQELLNIIKL